MNDEIVPELAWQMGRPVRYGGEFGGVKERAHYMVAIAEEALAPVLASNPKDGFRRYVKNEPLGVVMVVAPWNYPYLTAVNTIVPALMAGTTVILKHAAQTLLVGERFAKAFEKAGLPKGVFQNIVLNHAQTEKLIGSGKIDHVNFTGSVAGGRAIEKAAAGTFMTLGLELGGKDPAYVLADAKLDHAVDNLVEGAFFNSGQCCCGIERVYVHEKVYDDFVDGFVAETKNYVARQSARAGDDDGADGAGALRRFHPRAEGRGAAQGRQGAHEHEGRRATSRLALSAGRSADQCRPPDERHARGKLWADRRHHEGAQRRGSDRADERQPLRPDGLDLDARHRACRERSATASRPARCS